MKTFMKILYVFMSILLVTSLNARENPFSLYDEETGQMYDTNDNPNSIEAIQEAEYIKKVQQKMQNTNNKVATPKVATPPPPKTYTKQEVDSLIKKTKQQNDQNTKSIVKKEIANVKKEPEQVVYVKPRGDLDDNSTALTTKDILPFVKIEFNDNKLLIHTDYAMFKKFSIDEENKLAFDFKAKVSFNSKNSNLNSKNFKAISVGNHEKGDFFRVALKLDNKPSKYSVSYENNIVTINLKEVANTTTEAVK